MRGERNTVSLEFVGLHSGSRKANHSRSKFLTGEGQIITEDE